MAEAAPRGPAAAGGLVGDRRLIAFIVAGVIFFTILIFFSLRACAPRGPSGYIAIYSNLDLKDAAITIAQLKELKIPYEIREQGRSIAVPRNRADDARLGLAAEGLPAGGSVGWEIFDKAQLGATDFDKRIQLIRAISGELSRMIASLDGIAEAKVQIVMPKTEAFGAAARPATASVLIRLAPGRELGPAQVRGIVNLVSASVEGLLPENVTIVDNFGRLLTISGAEALEKKVSLPPKKKVEVEKAKEEIAQVAKVEKKKVVVEKAPEKPKVLTPEEAVALQMKTKEEMEKKLAREAQALLNQFYPPNTVVMQVNLELWGPPKVLRPEEVGRILNIRQLTAVILVDEKVPLTRSLKKTTFATVAGAIGYRRERGDRIELRKVTFLAVEKYEVKEVVRPKRDFAGFIAGALTLRNILILLGIILVLFIIRLIRRRRTKAAVTPPEEETILTPRRGPREAAEEEVAEEETAAKPSPEVEAEVKRIAEKEPGRMANLLKRWLTEREE